MVKVLELATGPEDQIIQTPGTETIDLVILDNEEGKISLKRLTKIFNDLDILFEKLNKVYRDDEKIIVNYTDSGSPILFNINGSSKTLRAFTESLKYVFDPLFRQQKQFSGKIENLKEVLEVSKTINELKENGALTPEQAENLNNSILSQAQKIVSEGVVTLEMTEERSDQKELEYKETRLIEDQTEKKVIKKKSPPKKPKNQEK